MSVLFPCSPEIAFRYLVEPRNRPQWQSSLRTVDRVTPGEPQVGMTWRDVTWPGIRPRMELTRMEPFRVWTERGTWRSVSAELTLHFVAAAGGCRVDADMRLEGDGLGRYAAALAGRMAPKAVEADLRRAARLLG